MAWLLRCLCCCGGGRADGIARDEGDREADAVLGGGLGRGGGGRREEESGKAAATSEAGPSEAEGGDEFARLHREVLEIVQSDAAQLPGYNLDHPKWMARMGHERTKAGSIERWQEVRGAVEAKLETLPLARGRAGAACVGPELRRALRDGDDGRVLRCLDVAVRLGLDREKVLGTAGSVDVELVVERCARVVAGQMRDLQLSGAGDVMRWLHETRSSVREAQLRRDERDNQLSLDVDGILE